MGSQQSVTNTGPRKKVVMVGASWGGRMLTQKLLELDPQGTKLEILLIDKSEHFEANVGHFKIFANDCFTDHCIKFTDTIASYQPASANQLSFKQGKLTKVDESEIEIELPSGEIEKVDFDALCIVTGASYCSPWRADDDHIATLEERSAECSQYFQQVQKAQSILCVGAGPTGIETAGYIKEAYPEKKVAICQRGEIILPRLTGVHEVAVKQLTQLGVEVLLGHPYSDEVKEQWDAVIDCRGFKYLGPSKYMQGKFAKCVDRKTGQIFVNHCGMVTDKHPLITKGQPVEPWVAPNIFSFGDVCLTPMNELKNIPSMMQYSNVVAQNIMTELFSSASPKPYVQLPDQISTLCMFPVDSGHGVFKFNQMVKEEPNAMSMKNDIIQTHMGSLANNPGLVAKDKKNSKNNGMFFGMARGCCACLPMHIKKSRQEHQQFREQAKAEFEKYY